MKYYFFPLNTDEIDQPSKHGYVFVNENRDRLIESDDLGAEINTYDRGTTMIVFNGMVYTVHKDFVDISKKERIWFGIPKRAGSDNDMSNF